ncbi:MAG: hypothetical protein MJK04_18830, partial [Psychrosphaera sp.]|nr:hypothetical protein [Psychrosphaera sp.]
MFKKTTCLILCFLVSISSALADNTPADASKLTIGLTYKATIDAPDDDDWAKIYLPGPGTLQIDMDLPDTRDYDMELYDATAPTGILAISTNELGVDEQIIYEITTAGWYYGRRYGYEDDFSTTEYYFTKVQFTSVDPAFEVYGKYENFVGGTDVDNDGYYETFSFRIGIDGDETATGFGHEVYARFISENTGQEWWSGELINIVGTDDNYFYANFDETSFTGWIDGNTDLEFTVELWDATKQTRLAVDYTVADGPIKVDSIAEFSVNAKIDFFQGTDDADNDGYHETFTYRFGVDVDENNTAAIYQVFIKILSVTTGQSWWSIGAVDVSGTADDFVIFNMSDKFFAGQIGGNTGIDFSVEVWNNAKTTLLASTETVENEPVKADFIAFTVPVVTKV